MATKINEPEPWQNALRSFSLRTGFSLSLTRAMLEMLCAIAEDVQWDRALYRNDGGNRDNWIASQRSLEKRGLIRRKSEKDIEKVRHRDSTNEAIGTLQFYEFSYWELTPAGMCVVDILRFAGIFVEADAAINKKSRRA